MRTESGHGNLVSVLLLHDVLARKNAIYGMKRNFRTALRTISTVVVAGAVLLGEQVGDATAMPEQLNLSGIDNGLTSFPQIVRHGSRLFMAVFNRLDGLGRPGTTANGLPRPPRAVSP